MIVYLGRILYGLPIPMIAGGVYGFTIMLIMIPVLLYRMRYEERVLDSMFWQEIPEYADRTKKIIPFTYQDFG